MEFSTYAQFIEDAANEMVKAHLKRSNSMERNPSERASEVYGMMQDAYMERFHGKDWCRTMDADDIDEELDGILDDLGDAMKLADEKWEQMLAIIGEVA